MRVFLEDSVGFEPTAGFHHPIKSRVPSSTRSRVLFSLGRATYVRDSATGSLAVITRLKSPSHHQTVRAPLSAVFASPYLRVISTSFWSLQWLIPSLFVGADVWIAESRANVARSLV